MLFRSKVEELILKWLIENKMVEIVKWDVVHQDVKMEMVVAILTIVISAQITVHKVVVTEIEVEKNRNIVLFAILINYNVLNLNGVISQYIHSPSIGIPTVPTFSLPLQHLSSNTLYSVQSTSRI